MSNEFLLSAAGRVYATCVRFNCESLSLSLSLFLAPARPAALPPVLISARRFQLDQHAPRLYSIIDTPVAITRDTDNNTRRLRIGSLEITRHSVK